ncbi:PDDEXK nuclease domain-containing protein [Burkholderia sp. PR2]
MPRSDIERSLTQHIRHLVLELGAGFASVGCQYRLEVCGDLFSTQRSE